MAQEKRFTVKGQFFFKKKEVSSDFLSHFSSFSISSPTSVFILQFFFVVPAERTRAHGTRFPDCAGVFSQPRTSSYPSVFRLFVIRCHLVLDQDSHGAHPAHLLSSEHFMSPYISQLHLQSPSKQLRSTCSRHPSHLFFFCVRPRICNTSSVVVSF